MIPVSIKEDKIIEHADELIKTARRQLSFSLLACFYVLLIVAETSDVVLLTEGASAQLPLLSTTVDIEIFYAASPTFLLLIQIHYLAYTHKFWQLLGRMRRSEVICETQKSESDWAKLVDLEHIFYPWLLMDFARIHHGDLCKRSTPLSRTYGRGAQIMSWYLMPFTIFLISLDAAEFSSQDPEWEFFFIIHVVVLSLSVFLTIYFHQRALLVLCVDHILDREAIDSKPTMSAMNWASLVIVVLVTGALLTLYARNPMGILSWAGAAPDLERAELSEKPKNWPNTLKTRILIIDAEEAQKNFELEDSAKENVIRGDYKGWTLNRPNLHGAFAVGADFGSVELMNARVHETQLQFANMNGAKLQNSDFNQANVRNVNFIVADLSGSRFFGTVFDGADFRQARLRNTLFVGGSFRGTNFAGADLTGAVFTAPRNAGETIFGGPVLDLRSVEFGSAVHRNPNNGSYERVGTILRGADLGNATLDKQQEGLVCGGEDAEGNESRFPIGFNPSSCPDWLPYEAEAMVFHASTN